MEIGRDILEMADINIKLTVRRWLAPDLGTAEFEIPFLSGHIHTLNINGSNRVFEDY